MYFHKMFEVHKLEKFSKSLSGDLHFDALYKSMYATDASVYRKIPLAVAFPKDSSDIQKLIQFANDEEVTLIPRTAGTSLAGQCVGEGIVVDVSKYFTNIISLDQLQKRVTVQPGVIRDDLNRFLKPYGLFFGPNTSTSNRCMIGGMVGNNSSGSSSIQYGVTRDKVVSIDCLLSDGSAVTFNSLTSNGFMKKMQGKTLESKIYQSVYELLSNVENQQNIKKEFPKETIHRRNTGYAIDALLKSDMFGGGESNINLAKLLCGSEGTLAFSTQITIQLEDLPPAQSIMIAAHFDSVIESLNATVVAMKYNLHTCELMDEVILNCTKNNRLQLENRFFIKGDPKAILLLEVKSSSMDKAEEEAVKLVKDLEDHNYGYHHVKIYGDDIAKTLDLRSAGLGLLGNMIGDKKAVACIEDTAVDLRDLPNYIAEFDELMQKYKQQAVYYAHAGAGEIHLRPILNLKKGEDVSLFRKITTETAQLVKKYGGSFSGEHGDGIVRAEFIPLMIGQSNYQLLCSVKAAFDPNYIFNKGKIVAPFPMDKALRYEANREEPKIHTLQDFSDQGGILRMAEKCNGSGDCRKSAAAGGSMCPSYRVTKDEKDSTRARANTLREFLTNSQQSNRFNHKELKQVFDLCLSCKACASECPSNVDVTVLKSEFLHQYQEINGYSIRNKLFANNATFNKFASKLPKITNLIANSILFKSLMGISSQRQIPLLASQTLRSWHKNKVKTTSFKTVYLFCDEFTNFYDVEIGKDAIFLLTKLGYDVQIIDHMESGRSLISKGFLKEAKKIADTNLSIFNDILTQDTPLIGIEPSAILSFKDEYIRLATDPNIAKKVAKFVFTIEEFIAQEYAKGCIAQSAFTNRSQNLKIHGHCHQKALSESQSTFQVLNIPKNFKPKLMQTGCCGMAGSFGYEKEHYTLSMQVGEESLFPKLRKTSDNVTIVAAGTSCRHQIYDGTKRVAKHPVTVLKEALII